MPQARVRLVEVSPSYLLPELVGQRGVVALEHGEQRILVDRMRLVARLDGSIERATELLPASSVSSIALPSRLGGGYLFYASATGGTDLWHAPGWLDKLRPLTHRGEAINEIIPGFDRLYLRLASGNRIVALHPSSGALMPLGALPVASSYGQMAFADGWRAIVDTDLRGPLATFDAGLTWRPLGIPERAFGIAVIDGDPVVLTAAGGRYFVDARGMVSHTDVVERRASVAGEEPEAVVGRRTPLGKHPLRAAVEDGWPDTAETALVARNGALARVSLHDGTIVALVEDAYPEHRANCHAVRLGSEGLGFLCGEREGPTVVYAFVPPLGMNPVLRFAKPRFIASSGNGALVIRGRCSDQAPTDEPDAHWYCVRAPSSSTREIRVKGSDVGIERVVGLRDGRVAVLVPPRGEHPGHLSLVALDGHTTQAELALPSTVEALKRGLWLHGFEERSAGLLSGWVEAAGPMVGVEITLDGKVRAGEVQQETSGAVVGGRFGVLLTDGGRAFETTDGGMTYRSFDLPARDEEARAVPTRAAGPVGAALPGWVRVGWGLPATPDDRTPAPAPSVPFVPMRVSPTLALSCEIISVVTPPLPNTLPASVPPRPSSASPWIAFRNTIPPSLGTDELGVDNGSGQDGPGVRAYAWGKRGADWSHTGRWLMRFDDRFDASGGVRSTSLTVSLWADEAGAIDGIRWQARGSIYWSGILDPSGRALLGTACRGSSCTLYAAVEGEPVTPIRDASGRASVLVKPLPHGAVRLGETWLFLTQSESYDALTLWRVDLGVARAIGTYLRPTSRYGYEAPRLVRRARHGEVGLLVGGAPEPGDRQGSWNVLPVHPETGELGEMVPLVRRDFSGPIVAGLSRCSPDQDGWVFDVTPDTVAAIEVDNARGHFDTSVDMRVRVDPGRACVESLATQTGPFFALGAGKATPSPLTTPPGRKSSPGNATETPWELPLAATEKATGRRWGLVCRVKPKR